MNLSALNLMNCFTSVSICGLLSLSLSTCRSHLPPPPTPVNRLPPTLVQYTKENSGLPSNAVSRVVIDRQGIVWAGTYRGHIASDSSRGLARFDGTNWQVFDTQNSPLPGNGILDLALAPDDALWVATDKGLARFDGKNWRVFTKANAPFPSDFIVAVDVVSDGRVWAATGATARGQKILFLFDGTRWQEQNAPEAPTAYEVSDLLVDRNQTLFSTRGRGLLRRTAQQWTVFRKDTLGMPLTKVGRLHEDGTGGIWMTPYNGLIESSGERTGAIVRFDGRRFEAILFPADEQNAKLDYFPFYPLSITTDVLGRPWVGEIAGLYRYDGNWHLTIPRDAKGIDFPFYDLTFQAQKRLWVATNRGLLQFMPE
ncbi:MAG: hypothetical protein LH606_07720 [Cytophagaceae bacterium]|nr:hypothetical protein [Cytophagaceae bacterium]